jgi:hypothetical protein
MAHLPTTQLLWKLVLQQMEDEICRCDYQLVVKINTSWSSYRKPSKRCTKQDTKEHIARLFRLSPAHLRNLYDTLPHSRLPSPKVNRIHTAGPHPYPGYPSLPTATASSALLWYSLAAASSSVSSAPSNSTLPAANQAGKGGRWRSAGVQWEGSPPRRSAAAACRAGRSAAKLGGQRPSGGGWWVPGAVWVAGP